MTAPAFLGNMSAHQEPKDRALHPRGLPPLELILSRAYPLVKRWIEARGCLGDDAEDIAQEVMLAVLRGLPSFQKRAQFNTWLFRVTHNVLLDHKRKEACRRHRYDLFAASRRDFQVDQSPGLSPAESTEIADLRRLAVRLAAGLRPEQREVFCLVALDGLTSPEISARLGIAPSSVRARLLKARRSLHTNSESTKWLAELLETVRLDLYGYRLRHKRRATSEDPLLHPKS
jgi:RNA polymerase sigma-70 factor, ECF subfamily